MFHMLLWFRLNYNNNLYSYRGRSRYVVFYKILGLYFRHARGQNIARKEMTSSGKVLLFFFNNISVIDT